MMWPSLAIAFATALVGTHFMRRYALKRQLIDHPNARSSHAQPTPRGGGVAIVVTFLAGLLALFSFGEIPRDLFLALFPSSLAVAAFGFWDDHGHVPAKVRIAVHFAAAAWAVFWIGGPATLDLGIVRLEWGWFGRAAYVVGLVWLLNLYNFMDGIDGIAGAEGLFVALAGAALVAGDPPLAWLLGLLGASCAGFLVWNWPPAKIFMGDAGSGFIGLALGVMSLEAARPAPQLLWAWLILLGVFIVDATVTLLRRVLRGEKFYEAHRSHAYQYASRRLGSHRSVSLAVSAINLIWLLPIAALVAVGRLNGILGIAIAYVPLVWLAFQFKAGSRELLEV